MEKIRLDIVALSSSESHVGHFVLILEEAAGSRRLPIVIGGPEAQAIALEIERIKPNRPMTHDLFFNTCHHFDIDLQEVLITDLQEGIFHASLVFEHNGEAHELDARPSDGIALAVRFRVPIYTTEKILREAGIEKSPEDIFASTYQEGETADNAKTAQNENQKSEKTPSPKSADETISELNKKLEAALLNEDYELAAKIRDSIKQIST